ncbi:MAG: hypothetical protein GEV11_10885 [Streptosporangiales bacterium]|nr:hypothetical protein [Streptosporangiales bacterium]
MGRMPSDRPAGPFTPLHFQLVLLRRMADHNPELVEAARRELGVSVTAMREANRRWQAMRRAGRRPALLSRYRSILGVPESTETRRFGDVTCQVMRWPVPLWPGLRFEVLLASSGAVLNEWLVRAPGARPAVPAGLADLTPWSCTVDEAARAFAPAVPLEGSAPGRWGLAFTAADEHGVPRAVVAEFTWGLMQRWWFRA